MQWTGAVAEEAGSLTPAAGVRMSMAWWTLPVTRPWESNRSQYSPPLQAYPRPGTRYTVQWAWGTPGPVATCPSQRGPWWLLAGGPPGSPCPGDGGVGEASGPAKTRKRAIASAQGPTGRVAGWVAASSEGREREVACVMGIRAAVRGPADCRHGISLRRALPVSVPLHRSFLSRRAPR